ncbi:DUF350 domain-containing protein [Rubritalea spongiae]|uniref:DUF350 domain-containing protein n=1 Tax=Rubritalea spongiae TaxID=430797 RepID=A0ABW5E2Y6_9BACT
MLDNFSDLAPVLELLDWRIILYLTLSLVILLIAKLVNQALSGYKLNEQITHIDNKAIALSFAGFVLAVGIILSGVLNSPSSTDTTTLVADLTNTAIWGAIGCAMLLLSRWFNDKCVLPQFSTKRELVTDKNVGVGAVQAAVYLTTALIIRASIAGEDIYTLPVEIGLSFLWFAISQTLIFAFSKLYSSFIDKTLHSQLEQDNAATGVAFGGALFSYGLLISFYITRFDGILGLLIWALVSAILLCITRLVVDKMLLPSCHLNKEIADDSNWGAALIEVATSVGAALIITGSFS